MVKIDLKDAYFSVPIAKEHRRFVFRVGRETVHNQCSSPWPCAVDSPLQAAFDVEADLVE